MGATRGTRSVPPRPSPRPCATGRMRGRGRGPTGRAGREPGTTTAGRDCPEWKPRPWWKGGDNSFIGDADVGEELGGQPGMLTLAQQRKQGGDGGGTEAVQCLLRVLRADEAIE